MFHTFVCFVIFSKNLLAGELNNQSRKDDKCDVVKKLTFNHISRLTKGNNKVSYYPTQYIVHTMVKVQFWSKKFLESILDWGDENMKLWWKNDDAIKKGFAWLVKHNIYRRWKNAIKKMKLPLILLAFFLTAINFTIAVIKVTKFWRILNMKKSENLTKF